MANVYTRPDYQGIQTEDYTQYFTWTARLPDPSVFTAGDITLSNGVLSNFEFIFRNNELTTYQATITPPSTGSGNTRITVRANIFDSNESITEEIPYAQSATNTVQMYSAPDGTQSGPYWIYIWLHIKPATLRSLLAVSNFGLIRYLPDFNEDDITVTNGVKSGYTGVIVPPGSQFADASVKFIVTPPETGSGNTVITVRANAIGDNPETTLTVPYNQTETNVVTRDASIPQASNPSYSVGRTLGTTTPVDYFTYDGSYILFSSGTQLYRLSRTTGEETAVGLNLDIPTTLDFGGFDDVGLEVRINRYLYSLTWNAAENRYDGVQISRYQDRGGTGLDLAGGSRYDSQTNPFAQVNYRFLSSGYVYSYFEWRGRRPSQTRSRTHTSRVASGADLARLLYDGAYQWCWISTDGIRTERTTGSNTRETLFVRRSGLKGLIVRNFGAFNRLITFDTNDNKFKSIRTSDRLFIPIHYTARENLAAGDTVTGMARSETIIYLTVTKSLDEDLFSTIIRYNTSYGFLSATNLNNSTIHDICVLNNLAYIIYTQDNLTYLAIWPPASSGPTVLATINNSDRFLVAYNNLLYVSGINVNTLQCYSVSGQRLPFNDFSLIHSQELGTIKSLSSSDRGINVTHRLGTSTWIYRYDTTGTYQDSIAVATQPNSLLTKGTDLYEGTFYIADEKPTDTSATTPANPIKIVVHEISLEAEANITFLAPTKITVRNFEPLDLNTLFAGETDIQPGIGILVDIDHTLDEGILTLKFVRGSEPFFRSEEIFFGLVALNNSTFLEQELYLTLQQSLDLPIWTPATEIIMEQPDTVDLHEFVFNADSITFKSGTTPPNGVTLSSNTLMVATDTVTMDSRFPLSLTATNNVGSIDRDFTLNILNTHNNLKTASYWQTDIIERVFINDEDITEYVESVNGIDLSFDSQFLNVQTIGDATVEINDPEGYFSSGSFDNFFASRGLNRLGYFVPLKIEYGYRAPDGDHSRVLFFGYILKIVQDTENATATITATDYSERILSSSLHNFGLEKKLVYTDPGLIGTYHGEYQLNERLLPLSNQSLQGRARNFAVLESQNENSLATEGVQNWANIKTANDKIESEGGLIPYTPIFNFKTSYKYFTLEEILRNLLTSQDIYNYKFNLLSPAQETLPAHFQNLGSPVYKFEENIDFSVRDWFGFSGDSYYLLGSDSISESDKFIKKQKNKVITNLYIAEPATSLWKVAIEPFRNILWFWASEKFLGTAIPLGTYDSSEATNKTKLIRYDIATDVLTTSIGSDSTNAPQLAQRYLLGKRDVTLDLRRYSLPNNRGYAVNWYKPGPPVQDYVYYKSANSTSFGISNFDLIAETNTSIISQANDIYGNASCFDLALAGDPRRPDDQRLFFAYTVGENTSSTLFIKEYNPSAGTTRIFYQSSVNYTDTDFFDELEGRTGAIYNGVFEVYATDDDVYVNVQLQKEGTNSDRSYDRNAGAILYKIPRTGATNPTANDGMKYMMKVYEWCQISPYSFIEFNGNVHFFEGSPHIYRYKPILDSGEEAAWKEDSGFVRFEEGGEIKTLGIAWRDLNKSANDRFDNIYGAIDNPIRVIRPDNNLHLFLAGEPEGDSPLDYEEIVFSTDIQEVIPVLETNGRSVYDILSDINQLTYTFSRFESGKLIIDSKLAHTAEYVTLDETSITFRNLKGQIPLIGFIKLGQEFISYEDVDFNTDTTVDPPHSQLTGIQRNRFGSSSNVYAPGETMLFFDHILDATAPDNPILAMSFQNDYNFLANVTQVQYGRARTNYLEDARSIQQNDRKEITVPTQLDDHQRIWAEQLNKLYLAELKDLKQNINLTIKPSFYLRLGETVILRYPDRAHLNTPCRIVAINFTKEQTELTLKTLQDTFVTKFGTRLVYRFSNGIAFDPITDRLYYSTRWQSELDYYTTESSGAIDGDDTRAEISRMVDWEGNIAIVNQVLYTKDRADRIRLQGNNVVGVSRRNIIDKTGDNQWVNATNRDNIALVVTDDERIYIGERLAGNNILRRVHPVANPSYTNTMTTGEFIQLEPRRFSQSRGHIVNVIGDRSLKWWNGDLYGVDQDNHLIVKFRIDPIPGTPNFNATITEDVIEIPDDIIFIGDICRGNNAWYVVGDDGTVIRDDHPRRRVLWIWIITDG